MHNSKPIDIPIEKGHTLSLEDCPKLEKEKRKMTRVPNASAVGSLMYVMLCTRIAICFAVGIVIIKVIQDLFIGKQLRGFFYTFVGHRISFFAIRVEI